MDVIGNESKYRTGMKLLVDAHCFDYATSEGINTYIKGLYGALTRIASDIDFYFAAQKIDKVELLFGHVANVHYIQLTATNKIKRLLTEFPCIIQRYGIDYAHFQYTSPLIKNCKTIITLHDILFKDYPQMFPLGYRLTKGILFGLSARRADLLFTVSDYSRSRIALHYGIDKNKIYVTPNAVSEDFFHIDANQAHAFVKRKGVRKYILYVSRIEPRKNQIALLRAFHDLRLVEKGYDLVFIGRKTLPVPDFDELLASLPKEEKQHIHIYNQVSYEELKLWYKAASLFVYPALAEGFGIPPIEAGAAGVPCVCSNLTAMSDFTFFENNLVDVTNSETLKSAIVANLSSLSIDTNKICSAIHSKYNWQSIAENFYMQLRSARI